MPALQARGHQVQQRSLASGLVGVMVVRQGANGTQLAGGVDPRREGEALGD